MFQTRCQPGKKTERVRTWPLAPDDPASPAEKLPHGTKRKARTPDPMSGDASR
jgi:hypothetical protein